MKSSIAAAMLVAALPVASIAQEAPLPVAQSQAQAQQPTLPANTEIVVVMNKELSSSSVKEGETFSTTVQQDVQFGGYVVIPRGSRAVGEVTWKTGKGAFGKSGKMEVEMRYIDVGGRRIPIEGKFRQEGEGNTVATVAGVIAVGVFAGFITGKTAIIPRGRELIVHTKDPVPLAIPAQSVSYAPAAFAPVAAPAVAFASRGTSQAWERRSGESCSDYASRVAGGSGARNVIEQKCLARR